MIRVTNGCFFFNAQLHFISGVGLDAKTAVPGKITKEGRGKLSQAEETWKGQWNTAKGGTSSLPTLMTHGINYDSKD